MPSRFTPFGPLHARLPIAGRGQRIGLMGGSFNPPHAGHLHVAETALKRLHLDAVWWLVTPGNPLKSHGDLAPLADRVADSRRLAGSHRIRVTDLEAGLGSSYSAATVAHLRLRRPDLRFVWIIGADNLAQLHRWRAWRRLAAALPIAVVDRPGWRLKALASPAARALAPARVPEARAGALASHRPPAWTLLTARHVGLSSTALRRRMARTEIE